MKLLTLIILLLGSAPNENPVRKTEVFEPKFTQVADVTTIEKTSPPSAFMTPLPFSDVMCIPSNRFFEAQKKANGAKETRNKTLLFAEGLDNDLFFINKFSDGSVNFYRVSADGKVVCYFGTAHDVQIDKGVELWDGSNTEG